MNSLVVYPDAAGPVSIPVANGFVSRVVGWVAAENIPDAIRVAKILNAESAAFEATAPRSAWWESDDCSVSRPERQT